MTTYTIRVEGHLDDHWSDWLGGLDLARGEDGATTVSVQAADQAQLHGVLAGLRDIGAVISSLQAVEVRPALERELRTERLTLRPADAGDAEATWAYRRLDSVNEWLAGTPADLDRYREQFADPVRLAAAVIVARGDTVIGDFMLRREDAWAQHDVAELARGAQAEVGWVLDPAHTGRGYALEAVRELLRYCLEELGVRRVTANCFLANEPSVRLMERLGMRRELHAVRDALHRSGRWLDSAAYAILAEEWRRA